MSEVSIHRWPMRALLGDLVRGGVATGSCVLLMLASPIPSIAFFGSLAFAVLFGVYLAASVSKTRGAVEVDDLGVRMTGLFGTRAVKWAELQRFELRHFPLSRDQTRGWMDLKVTGRAGSIAIDDRLERFDEVLARAWAAARTAEVGISDTTHHNLVAAGVIAKASER